MRGVQLAPESVEVKTGPFKAAATSLVPSDDEAIEYHCPLPPRDVQFPPESVEV